jgi:hypothetical protein
MKYITTIDIKKSDIIEITSILTQKQKTDLINELIYSTMNSKQINNHWKKMLTDLKETELEFDNRKEVLEAYDIIINTLNY